MSLTNTKAYNESLSEEEKLAVLRKAKERSGTWYDGWKPYCVHTLKKCDARLNRMQQRDYGFQCTSCGDMIGFDLVRLVESPLKKLENSSVPFGGDVPEANFQISEWQEKYRKNGDYSTDNKNKLKDGSEGV